ncbi:MAG: alcohol dehydrogenase catalytic domain-containing protein [Candidatus Lokiarchaeota archaeon]|nr:alcohol dehydrogenase catalytic domain-containing protein [Candidatus Lokiarchaeota archaeon]
MKTVRLYASWDPKPAFKLGNKDISGKLTYLGSQVWRNPELRIEDVPIPTIKPNEVLIEVKRCGICGSDVHMYQINEDGYIWYPGLTAFPCTLGHEFAGVVAKAGNEAINKRTNKRFEEGEPVTVEEMVWCGQCKPCCDGYPNHCEALQEIGFSIDGAYAKYIAAPAKLCWSLKKLEGKYQDIFMNGSLVEPTSVAYNAVIERGGGIRPGENVVILGAGPVGIAATAILKRAGASVVLVSEPNPHRAAMAKKMGADYTINPAEENFVDKVKECTDNEGAALYLEATGLPHIVTDDIQNCIWETKSVNSTVVIVARADQRMPLMGEVFQVRRGKIVGAQGHSGHGTFPNVISLMGSGMDMSPMITKTIKLEEVPENLKLLQTDRENCKISVKMD